MLICRCQFLLGFVVLFFSSSVHAESVVEEMIAAWKTREARYQTGHIEFGNVEQYPVRTYNKTKNFEAEFDGIASLKHQVIFDAKRGRYTREGFGFHANTNRWLEKKYTAAFDGEFSSSLYEYEDVKNHPPAFVEKSSSILGKGWDYHSTPVFMAFRPMTKSLQGLDPRELGEPVRRTRVNHREVIVFSKGPFEYSFDPQREYILLRQELLNTSDSGGIPLYRLDIQYREDTKWGVVPKSWTLVGMDEETEKVNLRILGRIKSMEFNTPVEDRDFEIEFPTGSIVSDARAGMNYIVQDDGTFTEVVHTEKSTSVPHKETTRSETLSITVTQKKEFWLMSLFFGVASVLCVFRKHRTLCKSIVSFAVLCPAILYGACAARCDFSDAFNILVGGTETTFELISPPKPQFTDCYRIFITDKKDVENLVNSKTQPWECQKSVGGTKICRHNSGILGVSEPGEVLVGPKSDFLCYEACLLDDK